MRRMVRSSSGWRSSIAIGLTLLPFPVLGAEPSPRDVWETLRESGGALIEDLKARARPRWVPEQWSPSRPVAIPLPEGKSTPIDRWLPASLDAPRLTRIVVKAAETTVIEGSGTPGSRIELRRNDRILAITTVTENGTWRAVLSSPLAPGTHRIESYARLSESKDLLPGSDVRISIPERWSGEILVTGTGEGALADPARAAAEALAHDASERFTEIVPGKSEPRPRQPAAPSPPVREAQTQAPKQEPSENRVLHWLERSARTYQETVIADLAQPAAGNSDRESERPQVETGGVRHQVTEWLARSRRAYEIEVAERLGAAKVPGLEKAAERTRPPLQSAATDQPATQSAERATEEARSRRDRDNRERIRAAELRQREEETRRLAAEAREKQAAARREADAKKLADERVRLAEIERNKAEASRLAGQARRERAEAARRDGDAKRLTSAEAQAAERQKRQREEAERARLASEQAKEQRRVKAAEARAKAEDKRVAEEKRKAEAKAAAEEARRKEAERKEAAKRAKETPAQPESLVPPAEDARVVRQEERAMEQEDDAMRLAADLERRAEEAGAAPAARRPRDLRPAEGSAEGDDEDQPVAKAVCRQGRGRRVKGGRMHVVQPGESLWGLSQRYYGSGRRYMILYRANRARVSNPDLIVDCQRLFIPMRRR